MKKAKEQVIERHGERVIMHAPGFERREWMRWPYVVAGPDIQRISCATLSAARKVAKTSHQPHT